MTLMAAWVGTRTHVYTDWVEYWHQRRFVGNPRLSEPEKPKTEEKAVAGQRKPRLRWNLTPSRS